MRQNNNPTTDQQVIDYYVKVILWVLAVTIILVLLFNAGNIADAIFSGQPLLHGCEVEGGC